MDWLIPEVHQAPAGISWLALTRRESTPGLVDAVVAELGGFGESENRDPRRRDVFDATAAAHILRTHRPNLLLLHLVHTDYAQHASGPRSLEARDAYARVDARIGELVAAVDAAGIRERTAFVITGDHGFHRVHSEMRPNVVLRQAGLLRLGPDGRVSGWKAIAHRAAIRLADPADAETAARVRALFADLAGGRYRGLLRLVEREELLAREADDQALLYLEPVEGYSVSESLEGEAFVGASTSRGTHGSLPELEGMHTGLLLSGAGVRRGVTAPLARMVDVAPTVARLLGFELPEAEGVPMVGLLDTGGH
jgi:predicted AlkP superfamily pyrophosphatase or phosphodiesterase